MKVDMVNSDLKEKHKQMFAEMEQKLQETWHSKEDSLFYYHSSEDRIVLSHALFWVITQPQYLKGKIRKEKLPTVTTFSPRYSLSKLSSPLGLPKEFFLLLRQYQVEMLDAFHSCEFLNPCILKTYGMSVQSSSLAIPWILNI